MLSMKTARQKLIFPILVLPLVFGLAACGSKEAEKPASQVAAKVNSGEISVHLINYVLTRTGAGASTPEMAPKIRRQVLDRLVDQELAVEQAVEKKLDRSPDVLMAVDAARREIIARAYLEQITGALAKPTAEEARKYYAAHPQLFAERRIYNIQEIMLPAAAGVAEQLGEMLNAGKSMDDVVNWLKSKDIKFSGGSATRPAEQIPLELLPKIHTLKVGQIMVITNPQAITVMRIAAAQSAPLTEDAALPRIQQFLGNQRAAEALKQELKQLKDKAKITYMGEFANTEYSAAAPQAATLPSPTTDGSASKPPTDAAIEKGIAGLK
ncbi:MAG: peptidyl-prolyl cis-trans isomerase, EpsD family [Nitrosomonadaceae bacterium]|nr:MAG: peptidyl-prolyl cis-trans isomerase, EpsD family [Nitrosomonadaceae bacterium]